MSKRGMTGRGKVNHKGRNRHFITEAEMEAEREKDRKDREWKQRRGNHDVDEDADGDEEGISKKEAKIEESGNKVDDDDDDDESSSESDSDEEEKIRKPKGVDGLIEIQNPNRAQKVVKKVTNFDVNTQVNLSRREREELERQQAHAHYLKLQAEGKTEQAQKDLARLAIIRKQREELAKKRDEAKKAVDPQSKGKK